MIKQSIILIVFLLLFFIPTKPSALWRLGSTVGTIFVLNWMHLRLEQTEKIQRSVYAHITNKSTKSTEEDFPPVGLIESSQQLVNTTREYIPVDALLQMGLRRFLMTTKTQKKLTLKIHLMN